MFAHCPCLLLLCYAAAAGLIPTAVAQYGVNRTTNFKTEPTFNLAIIRTTSLVKDRSLLAPGYLFIANDKGPQIYDQDCNLIWFSLSKPNRRDQDFYPCDYLGERLTHLCWHTTDVKAGHKNVANSSNRIFDSTYSPTRRRYNGGIDGITPNLHSFHMLPGGRTFLQPVYVPRQWDLRPYFGKQHGWIWDGCFQEVDVQTGNSLFEWCASRHLPLWETSIFFTKSKLLTLPGQTNTSSVKAGRGTKNFPFDFFHLNAMDKNAEGDYFLSARHFDQILKVAGPRAREVHGVEPGTTLWRLGGKGNNFDFKGFTFSKQHAIRHVSTSHSETIISLFDNAWENTIAASNDYSAGQIIKINNETMQAELLHEYPHPYGQLTGSQGDMQILPNSNVFIGWGQLPQMTEYDQNGTVLFHAHFENKNYHVSSYRAFKSPWRGNPSWPPKLLAYQSSCKSTSPLIAYVSWNGATEVRNWRFHTATRLTGPWFPAGTWPKHGFETRVTLSRIAWVFRFMPYVSVDALDAAGTVLYSVSVKTWVPSPSLQSSCNVQGCREPDHFSYDPELSDAASCGYADLPAIIALLVLALFVEATNYLAQALSGEAIEKKCDRKGQSLRADEGFDAVPPGKS